MLGRVNASGFQKNPDGTLLLVPPLMTARTDVALKSPTASSVPDATFPGVTGSQSPQSKNGVKPVPVLKNILVVACHPPNAASTTLDDLAKNCLPCPNGRSKMPYATTRWRETNESGP